MTQARNADLASEKPKRGALLFLRDLAIIFVCALLVSFVVKTYLIRSFYIPSGSMENTLEINDRIIVNELTPGVIPLKHGDVVVFKDPGGWLNHEAQPSVRQQDTTSQNPVSAFLRFVGLAPDGNDHLVKRVIGLPGDHVACCNSEGQLSVNGVPLDEPYITTQNPYQASSVEFSVTVPKKSLWVMGDNRDNSWDSRFNRKQPGRGFVPLDDVTGRAMVISWPFNRWQGLDDYPEVFAGVSEK